MDCGQCLGPGAIPERRSYRWLVAADEASCGRGWPRSAAGALRAHPDLAGRVARAGGLTDVSRNEQAGAGLDECSEAEFDAFQELNNRYTQKFAFPFIMAVKGSQRAIILEAFRRRVENEPDTEFEIAMDQVHCIARYRLEALGECED